MWFLEPRGVAWRGTLVQTWEPNVPATRTLPSPTKVKQMGQMGLWDLGPRSLGAELEHELELEVSSLAGKRTACVEGSKQSRATRSKCQGKDVQRMI